MKLFLLTQTDNKGYDTYDSCVVCAENEDEAKNIDPNGDPFEPSDSFCCWARTLKGIECEYIGEASEGIKKGTVIINSFNAG